MRLKHGAFRHLRMAAKGAALGTRRLLKKAGENFTLKKVDENFEMGAAGGSVDAQKFPVVRPLQPLARGKMYQRAVGQLPLEQPI